MNKELIKNIVFAGAGLGAGFGLGIFITTKRIKAKYEAEMAEEIASVKETYKRRYKSEGYSTPEEAAETLQQQNDIISTMGYGETAVTNIFNNFEASKQQEESIREALTLDEDDEDEEQDETDYSESIFDHPDVVVHDELRDPDKPYLITLDEFMDDSHWKDYTKLTLTYFEGDQTMIDEKEGFVDDIDKIIGEENLAKFGYGNTDKDMLYIRNEKLEVDFEIARDSRGAKEVMFGDDPVQNTRANE